MPLVIAEYGAIMVLAKYVSRKKDGGVYYFRRRVPEGVQKHYPKLSKRGELFFSLKTKNPTEAAKKAHRLASEQDAYWKNLQNGEILAGPEVVAAATALLESYGLKPGQYVEYRKHDLEPDTFLNEIYHQAEVFGPEDETHNWRERLPPVHKQAFELFYGNSTPVFMSQALKQFQAFTKEDPDSKKGKTRANVVSEFIAVCGDLPIDQYRRHHVNQFVTHLSEKGNKTTTVKRRLNDIRPVFNVVSRENELKKPEIFEGVIIPHIGKDSKERLPFSNEEVRLIQAKCLSENDDIRWVIALLSETGMRMAEAVGLRVQDVFLACSFPYVRISAHETRSLKTDGSERLVPLVGAGLWAIRRAVEQSERGFLFPRYINFNTSPYGHKATHASNTINKWLRGLPIADKDNKTAHSFRHSVQDRLRAVGVSDEIRNAICGWKSGGQGADYGEGFPIELLSEHLQKIVNEDVFPDNNQNS